MAALFVSIVPCQRVASSTTSITFTLSDAESIPLRLRLVVQPLKACVFMSQMFVWVLREQSLVEIAEKADVVPSSTAGQRSYALTESVAHTAVSLYRPRNTRLSASEHGSR